MHEANQTPSSQFCDTISPIDELSFPLEQNYPTEPAIPCKLTLDMPAVQVMNSTTLSPLQS